MIAISAKPSEDRIDETPPLGPPTLSIVIPTHNRPETLRECLNSILNQLEFQSMLSEVEVIITRDHHSNESKSTIDEIYREFSRSAPTLSSRLFDNDRAGGQSSNTNNGISRATGRYFQVLHDDDALHPCFLAVVLPLLREAEHPLVVVDPIAWDGDAVFVEWVTKPPISLVDPRYWTANFLPYGTFVPSISLIRNTPDRDVFFDETLHFVCDWELFARLLMASYLEKSFILHIHSGLVLYRYHDSGLSGTERGALTHLAEHAVLVRKLIVEHDFFGVMHLTDAEVVEFLERSERYRRSRLEHDLSSIRVKRLLSRGFRREIARAVRVQSDLNPVLTMDSAAMEAKYRRWVRDIIGFRLRARVRRELGRNG